MMIHSSRAGPSISRDLQIRQELLVETFPSNLILRGTKRSHVSCLFAGLVFCDFSHLYSYQVLQHIASLWSLRFSNLCAPVMHLFFGVSLSTLPLPYYVSFICLWKIGESIVKKQIKKDSLVKVAPS